MGRLGPSSGQNWSTKTLDAGDQPGQKGPKMGTWLGFLPGQNDPTGQPSGRKRPSALSRPLGRPEMELDSAQTGQFGPPEGADAGSNPDILGPKFAISSGQIGARREAR